MAIAKAGHNSGSIWCRRVYNSIDRDPEIDVFQKIWQREKISDKDAALLAGLASSTVKNMFGGKTRKPQHATFAKLAGGMGYRYGLQRDKPPDYEKEIAQAKGQFADYRKTLKRKKARKAPKKNGKAT